MFGQIGMQEIILILFILLLCSVPGGFPNWGSRSARVSASSSGA